MFIDEIYFSSKVGIRNETRDSKTRVFMLFFLNFDVNVDFIFHFF